MERTVIINIENDELAFELDIPSDFNEDEIFQYALDYFMSNFSIEVY